MAPVDGFLYRASCIAIVSSVSLFEQLYGSYLDIRICRLASELLGCARNLQSTSMNVDESAHSSGCGDAGRVGRKGKRRGNISEQLRSCALLLLETNSASSLGATFSDLSLATDSVSTETHES